MNSSERLESMLTLDKGARYLLASLAAAGLMIEASAMLLQGSSFSGYFPRSVEKGAFWFAILGLQALTLFATKGRLSLCERSARWIWPLVVIWIGFDGALVILHRSVIWLPLVYGLSQAFLLDAKKNKSDGRASAHRDPA